jgi:hypothetical protein
MGECVYSSTHILIHTFTDNNRRKFTNNLLCSKIFLDPGNTTNFSCIEGAALSRNKIFCCQFHFHPS